MSGKCNIIKSLYYSGPLIKCFESLTDKVDKVVFHEVSVSLI